MIEKKGRPPKKENDCLLRAVRTAMDLSVTKLASLSDVEYFSVYRAETGLTIRTDKVYKIAKALNISPDLIFYSIGQIPEDKTELIKKDPIFFKELIDGLAKEPEKLNKTSDYIKEIKEKIEKSKKSPEITKMISDLN